MHKDFFDLARKYAEQGEPVAFAMVVNRVAPSSSKPGDKAIITRKGEVKGWIGGGCTRGIVIKEAIAAIHDLKPRVVRVLPSEGAEVTTGLRYYKMTCLSGGSVDIYIEPIMPTTNLIILGRSHIARALSSVAKAIGYHVTVVAKVAETEMYPEADAVYALNDYQFRINGPNDYIVVCTQGEEDEVMLEKAIKANPAYVSFVSSRKKSEAIMRSLKQSGAISQEEFLRVKTPAGIDINAKESEEVAVSILAEIIREKRSETGHTSVEHSAHGMEQLDSDLYINPVCKIPVQKSTAKHVLEYEGEKVYFCCDGCKESFEKNPALYMQKH